MRLANVPAALGTPRLNVGKTLTDRVARPAAGASDTFAIAPRQATDRAPVPTVTHSQPAPAKSSAELVATFKQAAQTLAGDRQTGSKYRANTRDERFAYGRGFDCFSNEKGLPELVVKMGATGGAAVGVGGALLDIAAASRADMVISIDTNPEIREFFQVVVGVLLVADSKATAEGWSDKERGKFVNESLTSTQPGKADEIVEALKALKWPGELVAKVPKMLENIYFKVREELYDDDAEAFYPVWFHRPGDLKHLTELAKQGRIVAGTADLADPKLAKRLKSVLGKTEITRLHLSNAFDYIADKDAVLHNLAGLPLDAKAKLTTSTDRSSPEWRNLFGTFDGPKQTSVFDWIGDEVVWPEG